MLNSDKVLVLQYAAGQKDGYLDLKGHWDFPKGHMEEGETDVSIIPVPEFLKQQLKGAPRFQKIFVSMAIALMFFSAQLEREKN